MKRARGLSKTRVSLRYVSEFEDAIKAFNPNVTVPYWNYTVYHQHPKLDPIFLNYMFGAEVDSDKCLISGNFKNYKGLDGYCLKRELFMRGTSLPDPSDLDAMLSKPFLNDAIGSLRELTLRVEKFLGGMFIRNQSIFDPLHYCIQGFNLKLLKQWSVKHEYNLTRYSREFASVTDDIYPLS
ncbi:Tyrosinase [Entomophthora muscae]|uniref:Tyrosinase n=1 Tax=Entomophthora muscae TaxID=34485 RepID=A0ACC2SAD7_9FUNG|nr:Tyrosinase [Entomophthora muscae]